MTLALGAISIGVGAEALVGDTGPGIRSERLTITLTYQKNGQVSERDRDTVDITYGPEYAVTQALSDETTNYGPAGRQFTNTSNTPFRRTIVADGFLYRQIGQNRWISQPDPAAGFVGAPFEPTKALQNLRSAAIGNVARIGATTVDHEAATEYSAIVSPIKLFDLGPAGSSEISFVTQLVNLPDNYTDLVPVKLWINREGFGLQATATATVSQIRGISNATISVSPFRPRSSTTTIPAPGEVTAQVLPKQAELTGTISVRHPDGATSAKAGVALLSFGDAHSRFGPQALAVKVAADGAFLLPSAPTTATRVFATFYAHAEAKLSCAALRPVALERGTTAHVDIACHD